MKRIFGFLMLRTVLAANAATKPNIIFFEHEGYRAGRDGKWKLVAESPAEKWVLNDMEKGRTEMNNLASCQPDKVRDLAAQWEVWAKRAKVIRWPDQPACMKSGS